MNNLLAHVNSKKWAIVPSELAKLRAFAAQHDPSSQIKPKADAKPENIGTLQYGSISQNGVATINVHGVLYNPEGYIDDLIEFYFGGTSTPGLIADIEAVTNNSAVTAVVFNFHSPGGDVFGINEAADKIAALTAKKPTTAYCYGYCASAAYFLAAKCGTIVTDAQALLGSLGVVCAWADFTGMYEMFGIAYEEVTSENAPFKRLDIRKDEDRTVFMSELNGIENVFLKSVAKGRGVPLDTVKSDFGKGAVMAGWQAVKAGLADRVGSFDEVIKELSSKRKQTASATAAAEGDIDMSFKEEFKKFASSIGFKAEEDAEPVEKPAEEEEPETPAEPAKTDDAPPADEPAKDDAEALANAKPDAVAELAQLKAEKIAGDAKAFVDAEVKAGRLFPAEKATMESLFIQAANDDASSPLAEGSRVEALKANQTVRVPHTLTKEVVDAEANQVLLASGDRSDDEKRTELLGKSALGRSALKLVEGKKSATATAK